MALIELKYGNKDAKIVPLSSGVTVQLAERIWEFDDSLVPKSYTAIKGTPPIEFNQGSTSGSLMRQLKTGERVEVTPKNDEQLATFVTALDILSDARKRPELSEIAQKLSAAYNRLGFKNKIAYESNITVNGKPGNVEIQQDGKVLISADGKTMEFTPELKPSKLTNGIAANEWIFGDIGNGTIPCTTRRFGHDFDTSQIPLNSELVVHFSSALQALKSHAENPRTTNFPDSVNNQISPALKNFGITGKGIAG